MGYMMHGLMTPFPYFCQACSGYWMAALYAYECRGRAWFASAYAVVHLSYCVAGKSAGSVKYIHMVQP